MYNDPEQPEETARKQLVRRVCVDKILTPPPHARALVGRDWAVLLGALMWDAWHVFAPAEFFRRYYMVWQLV